MRVDDRPVPTIGGDRPATERWPAALYVGIEKQPTAAYVYDDYTATYDTPAPVAEHGYLDFAKGTVSTPDTPDMDAAAATLRLSVRARIDNLTGTSFPVVVSKQSAGPTRREYQIYAYAPSNLGLFATSHDAALTGFPSSAIVQPTPFGETHTYGFEARPGAPTITTFVDDVRTTRTPSAPFALPRSPAPVVIGPGSLGTALPGRLYWAQLDAINRARLVFPGIVGNYLTTTATLSPADDLEIVMRLAPTTWRPPALTELASKYRTTGTERTWRLSLGSNGNLTLYLSRDGSNAPSTASAVIPDDGLPRWVKVTRVAASGAVSYFTAPDQPAEPTTWTLLSTGGSTAGALWATSQPVWVGQLNSASTGASFAGRIMRVIVRHAIAGAAVLDMAENNAGTMATASTFVATSGQTVTVAETAGNTIVQPQPDAVVWRFDADDYPGTGTSYVDPRGRTWTLSNAAAIVPKVFGPAPYRYDDVQDWPFDRFDLWCQLHGLTITSGAGDPDAGIDAGHAEMTLDNRDGSLSHYDAQGRLVDFYPGRRLDVWAVLDAEALWLFSGTITAWRERGDGTIDAEAFDAFSDLNRDVGEWDPGHYADTVPQRLGKILDLYGPDAPRRFDPGTVTLHSYQTTATPLEEAQAVARSDGGLFAVDADGTVTYRARDWWVGRIDQPAVPTVSDNVCDGPIVVWDASLSTDDDLIANTVVLRNVADEVVSAVNLDSINRYGPQSIDGRSDDQWIGAAAGQALAAHLVERRGVGYLRLESFALYLHDARYDLWRTGIDRRIGDVVTFVHEQPATTGVSLFALTLVVCQLVHEITPESWVTTVGTTRAVGSMVVARYDRTALRYDDAEAIYVL